MNLLNRIVNIWIAIFIVLMFCSGYLTPQANAAEEEWKFFLNEDPEASDGHSVTCFLEDGKYMWVGTFSNKVFKVLVETLEVVDTLDFWASDMTYDRDGNIWFVGNGLKKLVGDSLIGWDQNNYAEIGLPGYWIFHASIDSTGNMWLAMGGQGLVEFDGQSCKLYDDTNGPFKRYKNIISINSIAVDKSNNIWVTAGLVRGVIKFDHDKWTVFDSTNSDLANASFYALTIDQNNDLWAGSTKGLYKHAGSEWRLFNSDNSEIKGTVFSMEFDKDNTLWCTIRSGGLIKYDGKVWKVFNQLNSQIHGNKVKYIHIDKVQNIWFGVTHIPDVGEEYKGKGVNIYHEGGIILDVDNNSVSNQFVNIFPNPVIDIITINSVNEYQSYEIINLSGNYVLSGNFDSSKSIEVNSLPSGTYCLKLSNGLLANTLFFVKY